MAPNEQSAITPGGPLATRLTGWLLSGLYALSPRAQAALGAGLGRCLFFLGIRRRVTLDNLQLAFPELSFAQRKAIAQGAYENMARVALEALGSHRLSDEAMQQRLRFENLEKLEEARKEGKGVLLATAHFGNWETLACGLARRGYPLSVVARPLKGALNARIIENRRLAGMKFIMPRGAVQNVVATLREQGVVLQLIDQSIPAPHGVFVPFFGRMASTTPGLSIAAQRSLAPVLVVKMHREGDAIRVVFEGPYPLPSTGDARADVHAHVATLTSALEQHIRAHPDGWLWLHRRWKVAPPSHTLPPPAGHTSASS